jgi:hypothetical protein
LKKSINDGKAGDYIKMKNFIDSLAYEARVGQIFGHGASPRQPKQTTDA